MLIIIIIIMFVSASKDAERDRGAAEKAVITA